MKTSLRVLVPVLFSIPSVAEAQTWVAGRTTPALREIVSLDATGEDGWPFGAEDVAGDGLDTFQQQEANVDIRSVYGVADDARLWVRLYVSDTGGAGGNIIAFVFVDLDDDQETGGDAMGAELHEAFTEDPSGGGYEVVVGFRGNEAVLGVWSWDGGANAWRPRADPETVVDVETDSDMDPLLLGAEVHGYLQAAIDHGATGLDERCDAVLFVRTWNDVPARQFGDINVGERAPCVSTDEDEDRMPDVLEGLPCEDDDDCPGGGICVDGECLPGNPCERDEDCLADERCRDGLCVPLGGDPCDGDGDCGDLVCEDGQCVPCEPPGDPCDEDRVCAPTGECVPYDDIGGDTDVDVDGDGDGDVGFSLEGGEVQGGACTCRTTRAAGAGGGLVVLLLASCLVLRRRG